MDCCSWGSLVLPALPVARAADQLVHGVTLVVKDPGAAAKRTVTLKAKETATDNTLVGDPTVSGATVTITVDGASPSTQTFTLPAGFSPTTHKPFWSGDAVKGFTYKDPKGDNGAVKSAQITAKGGKFQIKVTISGKGGPVDVVPPDPGSAGCAFLTIGGGDTYSVQFSTGQVTNKGSSLFKVAKPTSDGPCALPFITPPGSAPLRYRDPVFGFGVDQTSDVVYGSAINAENQTVTLTLDVYEPTGDTLTARPAIVWVHGGSFTSGDKTSPELVDEANTFASKGYFNVSINYRLEPGGCTGGTPAAVCITAIAGGTRGRTDRGALPAHERGDLRHRPRSHRDRWLERGRHHGAERGVQLQRGPERGGRRGGVPVGRCAVRHDRFRRRAESGLPWDGRSARAVCVGGEHEEPRAGRGTRLLPDDLRGRWARAVRPAPHREPSIRPRTSSGGSSISTTAAH